MSTAAEILDRAAIDSAQKAQNGYAQFMNELKSRDTDASFLPDKYAKQLPASMAKEINSRMQDIDIRNIPKPFRKDYLYIMQYMTHGHNSKSMDLNVSLAGLVRRAMLNRSKQQADWGRRFIKKYAILRLLFSISLEYIHSRQWTLITLIAYYLRSLTSFTDCVFRSLYDIGNTPEDTDAGEMHQALLNLDACMATLYKSAQAFVLHIGIFNDDFCHNVRRARSEVKDSRAHKVLQGLADGAKAARDLVGGRIVGGGYRMVKDEAVAHFTSKWGLPQEIAHAVLGVIKIPITLSAQALSVGGATAKVGGQALWWLGKQGFKVAGKTAMTAAAEAGVGGAVAVGAIGLGAGAVGSYVAGSVGYTLLEWAPRGVEKTLAHVSKRVFGRDLTLPFHLLRFLMTGSLAEVQGVWAVQHALRNAKVEHIKANTGYVSAGLHKITKAATNYSGSSVGGTTIQAGVGTVGGGVLGAAIGSVFGGVGAVPGAAIGAKVGGLATGLLSIGLQWAGYEDPGLKLIDTAKGVVPEANWDKVMQYHNMGPLPKYLKAIIEKEGLSPDKPEDAEKIMRLVLKNYDAAVKLAKGWSESGSDMTNRIALMIGQIFGTDPNLIYSKAHEGAFIQGFEQRLQAGFASEPLGLFKWISGTGLRPLFSMLDNGTKLLSLKFGQGASAVLVPVANWIGAMVPAWGVNMATAGHWVINLLVYVMSSLMFYGLVLALIALVFWFLRHVAQFIMRLLGRRAIDKQLADIEAQTEETGIRQWQAQIRRERKDAIATYKSVQDAQLTREEAKAFLALIDEAALSLAKLPQRARGDDARDQFEELVNLRTSISTMSDAESLKSAVERSAALHEAFRSGASDTDMFDVTKHLEEERPLPSQAKAQPAPQKKAQQPRRQNAGLSSGVASTPDVIYGRYGITKRGAFRELDDAGVWRGVNRNRVSERVPLKAQERLKTAIAQTKVGVKPKPVRSTVRRPREILTADNELGNL